MRVRVRVRVKKEKGKRKRKRKQHLRFHGYCEQTIVFFFGRREFWFAARRWSGWLFYSGKKQASELLGVFGFLSVLLTQIIPAVS